LQRKTDIRQKAYCYQQIIVADLDQNANDCELKHEQADKQVDSPDSDEKNHRDWLRMSKKDHLLQKNKSQSNVDGNRTDGTNNNFQLSSAL
jgi:hypothetical protein